MIAAKERAVLRCGKLHRLGCANVLLEPTFNPDVSCAGDERELARLSKTVEGKRSISVSLFSLRLAGISPGRLRCFDSDVCTADKKCILSEDPGISTHLFSGDGRNCK